MSPTSDTFRARTMENHLIALCLNADLSSKGFFCKLNVALSLNILKKSRKKVMSYILFARNILVFSNCTRKGSFKFEWPTTVPKQINLAKLFRKEN